MITTIVYRYTVGNSTTVTPTLPAEPYIEMYRLFAGTGKALTNGELVAGVIDIDKDKLPLWYEIVMTEPDNDAVITDMATLLYNEGVL